jgi:hypothetical protein
MAARRPDDILFMDPGWLVLAGIFAAAGVFALWNFAYRQSITRQLEARGFERADADAPAVERAWRTITGATEAGDVAIARCRRRSAGRGGWIYHFDVRERTGRRGDGDSDGPGAAYPAYLVDLRDPQAAGPGGVTLHVLPPGSTFLRKLVAKTADLSDARPRLDIGAHSSSDAIVAAFGDAAGKLDDVVPAAAREKLARASAHGFFTIHVRGGKAAFVANPAHRDIDSQMTYLNDWA